MPDIPELCHDLEAEHEDLDRVVAGLDDSSWDIVTPAAPWTVRDQIAHLSFFDEAARIAATDPDAFSADLLRAAADIDAYMNGPLEEARVQAPASVLQAWRRRREEMLTALRSLASDARIPWYGPPMSPASFISARLMETWAHGQDVADAIGVQREPTDRLFHIAHLGVRARPFSYVTNAMQMPEGGVRVELTSPGGEVWTWGESDDNLVSGSAHAFCLVVTQRRHPDDVELSASGELAEEWISIAQCFAGPPGQGRRRGQFAPVQS